VRRRAAIDRTAHRSTALLVDDDPGFLNALSRLLRAAGIHVLTAGDGQQALTLLHRHAESIGVVVSDYSMAQMNGAELLRAVNLNWPEIARVLLTGNADLRSVAEAVNEGQISGLFLKPADPGDLQREVIRLIEAHRLVTENRSLRARLEPAPAPPLAPLTSREVDVLRLIVEGWTNRAISTELGLSPATVKVHVGHIVAKLGARDRTQAAVRATVLGLVTPSSA
jgi:DNA-binding NarL/FixJ family response regulator